MPPPGDLELPMGLSLYRAWYFLREAAKNVRHSLFLTSVSISTIAVSLILVGFFAFVLVNANTFVDKIAKDLRVSVYLKADATPEALDALTKTIKERPQVEDVRYVSREEDRARSKELLTGELLEGLDEESLPGQHSLEVTLESRGLLKQDLEELDGWLKGLESVDGVDDTLFGADKLRVIYASIDLVKLTGAIISVIIVLAAIFFTFSTIKLAVYARHEEIQILRLVGATNRFIRVPFYIEGVFQGLVGSLVAIGILAVIRSQLNTFVREVHFLNLELDLLPTELMVYFLAGGVGLGLVGSVLSIGRYLKA